MKTAVVLASLVGLILIATPAAVSVPAASAPRKTPDFLFAGPLDAASAAEAGNRPPSTSSSPSSAGPSKICDPCSPCDPNGCGPPPCNPSYPTITFYIYNGSGQIDLGGTTYGNGQSTTVDSCDSYTLEAVNNASSQQFWYWYTTSGSVANQFTTLTTYYAGTANGALMLVPQNVIPSGYVFNWAAYKESGSGFTQAAGYFYIPSSISWVSTGEYVSSPPCGLPPDYYDLVTYWVGIGGVKGTQNLWQAGVFLLVSQSTYYTIEFYENYSPTQSNPSPTYNCYAVLRNTAGNEFQVLVNTGGGSPWGGIEDMTQGAGTSWSFSIIGTFVPDTSTVEWVVEDPGAAWVLPNTNPVTFWGCSSSLYGNLVAPIGGMVGGSQFSQSSVPQPLTNATSFEVSYEG